MDTIPDPWKVELADACMEVGADLVIEYNGLKCSIPLETLKELKEAGQPTYVMACVAFALLKSGKTVEETMAFFQEADENNAHLSIAFEAPDNGVLKLSTPEAAPVLDKLVQAAEKGC